MKIDEACRPVAAGRRRSVDRAGASGRPFGTHVAEVARPAVGPLPAAPLSALERVLAVQEIEDDPAPAGTGL